MTWLLGSFEFSSLNAIIQGFCCNFNYSCIKCCYVFYSVYTYFDLG